MGAPPFKREDFLAYYRFSPAALAVRESVRLAAVRDIAVDEPILDIGCGDGLFAGMAFPGKQVWGIDINPAEISRASATDSYRTLICGNICEVDLPKRFFHSAIANCSLEHVPDLRAALANIRSSLVPGARFLLIVPAPDWTRHMAVPELLARAGLAGLGRRYGSALDRVFHHHHLHGEDWWGDRLRDADFATEEVRPIVTRSSSWVFDLLLPPSSLGWLVKKATGRWVVAPRLRELSAPLSHTVVDGLHRLIDDGGGWASEYLIIARAAEP